MTKREFFDLADKYAGGTSTENESKAFEAYFDKLESKESSLHTWSLSKLEESRLRMMKEINQRKQEPYINTITSKRSLSMPWVVAASIAAFIVAGWFIFNDNQVIEEQLATVAKSTTTSQRASIILPDGTKVRLNIGSSISYPETFTETSREVQLSGEAYFEVTKDAKRPFIITSAGVKTTVLGTAFNLRAYPNEDIDVTVTEGKVKVATSETFQTLTVGQQALYSIQNHELTKRNVEISTYTAWTNPELSFELVPFEEVIASLGRWYHKELTIKAPSDSPCLVRANLENNGLIPILSRLQSIVSFKYKESEQGKIVIENKGCIN